MSSKLLKGKLPITGGVVRSTVAGALGAVVVSAVALVGATPAHADGSPSQCATTYFCAFTDTYLDGSKASFAGNNTSWAPWPWIQWNDWSWVNHYVTWYRACSYQAASYTGGWMVQLPRGYYNDYPGMGGYSRAGGAGSNSNKGLTTSSATC